SARCFSSRLPPPPGPTLFPYTTLFRSFRRGHEIIDQEKDAVHPFVLVKRHILDGKTHRFGERTSFAQFRVCKRSRDVCLPDAFGDRKSTRLNSSHVSISYAVFCLTKIS